MVSGRFPELDTVKDAVFAVPTGTEPKSSVVGVSARCFVPLIPVPDRGTVTVPVDVTTFRESEAGAATEGVKVTPTVTEAPGAMVAPIAGRPLVVKGGAGPAIDWMVEVVVPVFCSRIDWEIGRPVGC